MEEAVGIRIVVVVEDLVGSSPLGEVHSFAEVCLYVSFKPQNGGAVDSYG